MEQGGCVGTGAGTKLLQTVSNPLAMFLETRQLCRIKTRNEVVTNSSHPPLQCLWSREVVSDLEPQRSCYIHCPTPLAMFTETGQLCQN